MVRYKVLEEKINTKPYNLFGLTARDDAGNCITLHDVFTERSEAQRCVTLFNNEQLELVHLEQVIDEYLQLLSL